MGSLGDSAGYSLLQLSSANGPVYRRVKNVPLRDAHPAEIPVIDISPIFSTSHQARLAVASQVHAAATSIGFFYISNHGIPSSVSTSASQAGRTFFHQDDATKDQINIRNFEGYCGYRPAKTQRINDSESVDFRETFSLTNGVEDPSTGFPWETTESVKEFGPAVVKYWQACGTLAKALLHTFALSLSLAEDYFDTKTSPPDAAFAMNYYPPVPVSNGSADGEDVSIGSHTDFQLFTILWQDSTGGLQVLNPDGEWVNARPIEGTLLVNIGDYLQRITNDLYVSTVHRAKNVSTGERLSMAFFFGFGQKETCGVLETCCGEGNEAKYEEISCEEWVRRRVANMVIAEKGKSA